MVNLVCPPRRGVRIGGCLKMSCPHRRSHRRLVCCRANGCIRANKREE